MKYLFIIIIYPTFKGKMLNIKSVAITTQIVNKVILQTINLS